MKTKATFSFNAFEKISEAAGKSLAGGFSRSFSLADVESDISGANNCKGGNCAILCGSNIACNAIAGCAPTLH
jgi:hypothetical protein